MGLILLGHRGAGKTTLGRLLAPRLGWVLLDIDELIARAEQMNICEIFQERGEPYFRDREAEQIRLACSMPDVIIAPGGGAVLREETRTLLKASNHVRLYLKCQPQELWRRLQADPASASMRPPLGDRAGAEGVSQLLAEREPHYREVMTAELDVTDLSPEQAVEQVMKLR